VLRKSVIFFQRTPGIKISTSRPHWLFPWARCEWGDLGHLLIHECPLIRDNQGLQAIMWPQPMQEWGQVQGTLEYIPMHVQESMGSCWHLLWDQYVFAQGTFPRFDKTCHLLWRVTGQVMHMHKLAVLWWEYLSANCWRATFLLVWYLKCFPVEFRRCTKMKSLTQLNTLIFKMCFLRVHLYYLFWSL